MPAKLFTISVVDLRSGAIAEFAAEGETLAGVFKAGAGVWRATDILAGSGPGGPRMFRFRFSNGRTGENSAFIGQGPTIEIAWADGVKGTHESFRPKNDGRQRPSVGVSLLVAGRSVSRSIESFQGEETYEEERVRVRLAEERARLAAAGL